MAAAGDKVGGFTLVRLLGAGGMGETWEAVRHVGTEFEQRAAVKLPSPDVMRMPEGRAMLRREAALSASLRHPNIAAVIDWNEERGFIVCELVDGAPLTAVMREAPSRRLPTPMLVHVLAQVGRGLSHAHRRLLRGEPSPVIHRDMSPSNLVVDYDGNVKIVDFGIAKTVGSADRSQTIKGKLAYMAPEQATGVDPSPAFDQYALGVIAYEAAAGERPNDGAHDAQTLKNILNGRHVPIGRRAPELPSGLAELIERMLALEPAARFSDMDEMLDALEPFTPPLSIHRELAALVHRAKPPETIIKEDGAFVSRPVSFELSERGQPPSGRPFSVHGSFTGNRSQRRPEPRSPAPRAPDSAPERAYPRTLAAAPERDTPWSGPVDPVAQTVLDTSGAYARPSPKQRSWAGGLALLGSLTLMFAVGWFNRGRLWPAASDDAIASLKPSAAEPAHPLKSELGKPALPTGITPPDELADSSAGAGAVAEAGAASAVEATAPEVTAHEVVRAAPAPVPAVPSAHVERATGDALSDSVAVRVKVFPWGRVWIDGELRGSVPPILKTRLRPGSHTIAAGQAEAPEETRQLEIREGNDALVSFDLSK